MKIYLCILFFSLNQVFANNTISGKGLICNYGSDEDMYEVYLFYEKKYVSKYLFLEKDTYKIRENEKRNYDITKNYIELKPFKINKKNFNVIDTEFKKIIGNCETITTHDKAMEFIQELKNKKQINVNKFLGREEI